MNRLILLFQLITIPLFSQSFEYVYRNPADSSFNCYAIVIPEGKPVGLVVRDYSRLPDMSKDSPYDFTRLCTENNLMTLYANTSNFFPELFVSEEPMILLVEIIDEVTTRFKIPKDNIFIGGISASGTRALRFAEYCEKQNAEVKIKGVFAVDSPLDLGRFYQSTHENNHSFKKGMREEAVMMKDVFRKLFEGTPESNPRAFIEGSVFTHNHQVGGNAIWLRSTSVILFTEPDINWWIEERGATYFDINAYDNAAFTLKLYELGNDDVSLISTSGKGFDRQGNRKPHSWTIVNEELLLEWIINRLEQ